MNKEIAIKLLGGSQTSAAKEIGITPQSVCQWPDELPPALRDRVQAAVARRIFELQSLAFSPVARPSESEES